MPGSREITSLGSQAFKSNSKQVDARVLAVLTEEADLRHLVQQSSFTIHGRRDPLNEAEASPLFLAKVRIPLDAKERLRQTLALLGINRASLFPDLENLALELQSLEFRYESQIEELANELPLSP